MQRSGLTIGLGAVRRNVKRLLDVLSGAQLWAVVKGDGYGHGAVDVGGAALAAGATALGVATVAEGLQLRDEFGQARILVMGPTATSRELALAKEARLELVVSTGEVPEGLDVHLKLDTGMGRWGLSELFEPPTSVVGLMSHLASADCDPEFTETQIQRFREATAPYRHLTRHLANSADGLRRDLTGTEVRVGGEPRRVVGTVSMDAFAVELDRDLPPGTPVTLIGNGVLAEDHARVAGTINYELVCGINSGPARARRVVVDS